MAKGKQVPANEPDQDFLNLDEPVTVLTEEGEQVVAASINEMKKVTSPAPKSKKPYHEEWTCQIKQSDKGPVYEKLKKLRGDITMTEDQAAILNEGLLHGGNNFGSMYFLQK